MKKNLRCNYILICFIILFSINLLCGCSNNNLLLADKKNDKESTRTLEYDKVKNSLIRFHVIANSDNDNDQNLKIKVKDAVIDYLYPYLSQSESLEESRKIIKENMNYTKKIAEDIIRDNNYNYDVKVELSRENFPDKSYGNIVLPQGNYEAYRIIIGSGQGRNWWCVMFPPLCFVDESKAEVEYDKVEEKINSVSDEKDNDDEKEVKENNKEDSGDDEVQIKFRFIETIENLFK